MFSESDLGQGEWIFSASVPADMENIADASAARATLRISSPLTRLSNLSGVIVQGADLNIRVSTEGMVPVAGDAEVTLRAVQEGAQPRTVMGLLREGQTSITVTFAGGNALTVGDWVLSAESLILFTDANSTLAVTVIPPPKLTLSVDQGVQSGELRLVRISSASGNSVSLTPEGLAVSPDGRWLFNEGANLEVWEIDSVRGIVTRRMSSASPGISRGLAVSQDSRFVFVPTPRTGAGTGFITVWRLNANDGRLEKVAQYTEGGIDAAGDTVRGLTDVWDIVPSPDGRLLFVTDNEGAGPQNSFGGALSVWSINASGTLVQTDAHVSSGASDRRGLNQAAGAAVTPDGRLLFVGSFFSDEARSTLSIWRVNAEASTVSHVRTLSDPQRLARPQAMALHPSGRLLFVRNRRADVYLSVYRVDAAEEDLESVGPGLMGETLESITATEEVLIAGSLSSDDQIFLLRINEDDTVSLVSRRSAGGGRPFGVVASPAGGLVFANSSERTDEDRFITVWQVLGIPRVPAGQEVRVMVNAERAPGSALTVMVQARQGSRVRTAAATLMPSDTQAEAVFSGRDLGRGEWIFSASVPADMENIADASAARATLRIDSPLIRLSNLSGVIPEGADLNIRVSTEGMVPVAGDAEVTLRATLQEGTQPRTVTGLLREGQTSVTVTFAGEKALTEGEWVVSAETASILLQTDANISSLTVRVFIPPPLLTLNLQETAEQVVPAGSTLEVTVIADRPLPQTLTVTVQAVRTVTAPPTVTTAMVTTQLFAEGQIGRALFAGENTLSPGQWVLTIAKVLPEDSAEVFPQQLQVRIGPSALGLSAPMDLLQGQEAAIEVDTEVALGVEVRVMVTATHAGPPAITASTAAVLGPSALAAEARFPADMLSLVREGTWNFEITAATPSVLITDTEEFPLVDFRETSATLRVTATRVPSLIMELLPQPIDPNQPVFARLQKSAPIRERLTVDVNLMGQFGGRIVNRGSRVRLLSFQNEQQAAFGGTLNAGTWTLTAIVTPTVPVFPSTLTFTVPPPLLRLQRLGPASVAAGTGVTVRATALAIPKAQLLGVRVIARQAMRADVEVSGAVVGFSFAPGAFFADVRFTSLPPGEWMLTAEAEQPDTFRTEDARDTVTVEPAVLTLTPVSERVPAGESVRLILGSAVSLGVAVNVNVAAEPVSPSFSRQMRVVSLDEASTSRVVVYNPGELAPGIWNFRVQVTDAAVRMVADVSMATATLRIATPLIRLSNLSGEILQGADLNIRVSTEGMVPVAGDAEVTLRATLQEGTQHRTVTGRLLERQTSVTVTFAGGTALTEGEWVVSAETASTLLQTDANLSSLTVIVGPQPRLFLERTGGSAFVASNGTITLTLRLMPALSATVMVTVAVADEGSTILQQQQAALSSSLQLTFRASDLGTGRRLFTARGPAGVLEDSGAEVTVRVRAMSTVELTLDAPASVTVGGEFMAAVGVSDTTPIPAEATVTVTVNFDGVSREVLLTDAVASEEVSFTAPTRLEPGGLPVTATAAVEVADPDILQVMVVPAAAVQVVVEALSVQLTFSEPDPSPVDAGRSFTVTVGLSPALLADTTVAAVVTFNGSTAQVTLSDRDPESMVTFTAPASGTLEVTAAAAAVEPAGLVEVADAAAQSVRVRAMSTVELTLDAPTSVTAGGSFMVAVGVSNTTPIPAETTVMVTVSFEGAQRTAVLTGAVPTTSLSFIAPAASGDFLLMLSGSVNVTDTLRVMVLGASTQIAVVPVQLTLSLEGPGSVQVGEDFMVTVGTGDDAVPAGTTVLVTVSDGAMNTQAMLTARIPTASVSFTAPIRAGEVSVTAAGVPQTSSGSLEVAVSDASPLAVTASPLQLMLTLSVLPSPVSANGLFDVIVGISPALPAGASVEVAVTFGTTSQRVMLTDTVRAVTLAFMAPAMAGAVELRAESMGTGGALDLNVMPASATLQVIAEPTLLLELPPEPVDPAQPVSIRLRKSTTSISEELTVDITAMRQFGEMTLTRMATATLSPSDTTAAAVFGPGALSAGRWTLTASVRPPGTVPIIPSTATIMVRPPLLRLQRLGPASVAAGTRVTVRVEAEAMPEDEGLGVRVIARQAMRADRERSAVLGSQSNFSADVEFTSLPPGEWLLTAEAERPDTFRTEGATDTVTVEPAVLTLTPVSERVPAGESARLILGSVVPLGVAVRINVVAEPVSPSFLPQTTAVNLDAASTSAMVVYDPGELAPGIWNFNVQVTDAAVRTVADVSMATATLRIAAPLIRISNLSGAIPEGADLNIRVRTEGMVPVAGDAEVTLRAMLQEGTQQRTVTGRLLEGQTSITVSFADENSLTEGDWAVSAETASTLLQTDANLSSLTVIVGPPPRLLLELTGGSAFVPLDGTITLTLRLMPALSITVMVTVAVADEGSAILQQQQVALSSSLQLTFSASDLGTGRRLFTARGPAGVLEDSEAEVTVLVGVSAVLSANPEEDVFPGDEVRLSAAVFSGSDPAGVSVILEAAVTAPDGSMRSNVLIPVSAATSTGGLTFIPDAVPGIWTFNVIERDGISAPALTVVVAEVMPLDFNDPLDKVNADDLVLLLRYERLCAEGDSRPLPADCPALGSDAPLAAGLALESSSYRLRELQNVRLPDVTGTGSVQTLIILQRALANIQDELLLPAAASSAEAEQARDARLRIIRQLLERE